ncbi:MAG TPA: OmpH family outer membrane protein [Terriglobia bacterium]|jgi:outer membrane protein|nr:OmpH family outer membrane protein [Terriglobia bacterium]
MRKRVFSGTILAIALAAVMCAAQDPAPSSEKVAVINIQQAIAQTGEGKQALDALSKKYEPKRQGLQRQQDEINALQDQIQKQASTLSDEERARMQRDLDQKQRLFKREQDDDQADWQADNQDAVQRIGQKMVKVINDYALKQAYALVLDDSQLPVYYVAKGVDITDPIVKLYDQANPAPASAASSAPAAKPPATKPKP